ncbi:secreted protein [Streptomyces viridosporus ATCC 14672]|uniref:Secreted protein n=1 Tax=Streptomyces viridosporus (strain ATCC 14672 / DSM 40746 / JCM 4963 / KCTC 9882 / NRRL B-12104 / FH 1290) TaxID=566461 RepID=D5ZQC3_STRV1|nr:secreted protein [Streptomyces viridosporus ATCC 14672]
MTGRRTTTFSARFSGLAIVLGLALGVTACSDGSPEQGHAPAAAPGSVSGPAPREQLQAGTLLAGLQGPNGLTLTITSAERDPAGHLTIRGDLTNGRAEATVVPAALRGNELEVLRTGPSLAGATVVDFVRDKRYYVLRDTDGHPLTTTGLSTLKARERVRVFMQFPAPPAGTATVGLQLPLFDTATIKISG